MVAITKPIKLKYLLNGSDITINKSKLYIYVFTNSLLFIYLRSNDFIIEVINDNPTPIATGTIIMIDSDKYLLYRKLTAI